MSNHGKFDCIIIGGGHNGLVCAAYLAKAGRKVCLLERRHVLGGCATTEELWPGYKISTAAYVISLFQTGILRELKLKEHGLKILPRSPSSFTPLPDGRSLTMGPDESLNQREIGKFSMRDAAAYPRYEALLGRVAATLEPALSESAPDILPLPKAWRKIGLAKKLRDGKKLFDMYSAVKGLGADLPEAVELLTGAARPILERWFETDVLMATLATDAIIGAFTSISSPGSAYVLLHHVFGEAAGVPGAWGHAVGGMGAITGAMRRAGEAQGVEVITDCPVAEIICAKGKVSAVRTNQLLYKTNLVISSVHPKILFEHLVAPGDLPGDFRTRIKNYKSHSGTFRMNVALRELPKFTNAPSQKPKNEDYLTSGIIIAPSLEYMDEAWASAKAKGWSDAPIIEMLIPSTLDDTLAPKGKHVASLFCQQFSYDLPGNLSWDNERERVADHIINTVDKYAPGFAKSVLGRQALTPLDLERKFALIGGDIFHGRMSLDQLFSARPVLGHGAYRSPIKGLYMCGSGTHPGGGVTGAPGPNAAAVILKDRRFLRL
ncbi:MAG: NAD(P)/FAD-dependent oxidoreductase [Robiginitomaculum sp.]|nr:NAD(P)/FAD-dependent oxidoreductase [Robiginitomaculum sp.]